MNYIYSRPVICLIICDFMLDNETGRSDFTQHIISWPQSAMWRQRHAVWILQNYESFIIPTSAHSRKHKRHTSGSSNTLVSSSIIKLLFLFVCLFFFPPSVLWSGHQWEYDDSAEHVSTFEKTIIFNSAHSLYFIPCMICKHTRHLLDV